MRTSSPAGGACAGCGGGLSHGDSPVLSLLCPVGLGGNMGTSHLGDSSCLSAYGVFPGNGVAEPVPPPETR